MSGSRAAANAKRRRGAPSDKNSTPIGAVSNARPVVHNVQSAIHQIQKSTLELDKKTGTFVTHLQNDINVVSGHVENLETHNSELSAKLSVLEHKIEQLTAQLNEYSKTAVNATSTVTASTGGKNAKATKASKGRSNNKSNNKNVKNAVSEEIDNVVINYADKTNTANATESNKEETVATFPTV
tara:strand:+ start:1721 stop:2272 length:552 start_codon:yes stop_codon:yes gene_type:complete